MMCASGRWGRLCSSHLHHRLFWRQHGAFGLGDFAVLDRVEDELAQLENLACDHRVKASRSLGVEGFTREIAVGLDADDAINRGERIA